MPSRARVMVVDDSAQLRSALESLIAANAAFEVVATARDGAEAVELAKRHHPDIVLMDIRMPGMDGVEATRRILADTSGVNVVAHTAYDDAELVADMVRAGARGYLVKGVTADDLFDGLMSALEGEARISHSATRGLFDELGRAGGIEIGGEAEVLAARVRAGLTTDALTGTSQRSVFQFELEQAVVAALDTRSPLGVAVVRVSDLRDINTQFGWPAGDALLRGVGGVLLEVVGPAGSVGRIGGDELGVVLPGHDPPATRRLLGLLRENLAGRVFIEGIPNRTAAGYTCVDVTAADRVDPDLVLGAARAAAEAARTGTDLMAGDAGLCDPAAALTLEALVSVLGSDVPRIRARFAAELASGLCEIAGRPADTSAAFVAALVWSHISGREVTPAEQPRLEELTDFETLVARIAGRDAADLLAEVVAIESGGSSSADDLARGVDLAVRFAAMPDGMSAEARCATLRDEAGSGVEEVLGWLLRAAQRLADG